MTDETSRGNDVTGAAGDGEFEAAVPSVVERDAFEAALATLLVKEKAHTRAGDALAAARRRLPMVEVDASLTLTGADGQVTLLDTFEGRRQLIAYYFMWYDGQPATDQCEGCTLYTSQVGELSYINSRDTTYATFCQGPYKESARYREFMGWQMPWYSAQESLGQLLVGRQINHFYLICYLRQGERVFETYWTTGRGVEAMDYSWALLDRTAYGRQESWEDSPVGSPQRWGRNTPEPNPYRLNGRPIAHWSRLAAGRSDDLGTGGSR
jgi:predicted dithiol-disulfide oxidoreductase (DUF899 family)